MHLYTTVCYCIFDCTLQYSTVHYSIRLYITVYECSVLHVLDCKCDCKTKLEFSEECNK